MPWVALDDGWTDHPKLVGLCEHPTSQIDAEWLWVRLLTYCNRYLTDGVVKVAALPTIGPVMPVKRKRQAISALVRGGLLEDHEKPGGYWLIHNYTEWQPSKAEVEAKRAKRREAGRKGGLASGASRRGRTQPEHLPIDTGDPFEHDQGHQNGEAPAEANASPNGQARGLNPLPSPTPVAKSGLSLSVGSPQAVDERDREPRVDAAIELMAQSDLDARRSSGHHIGDPDAYLASCRTARRRDWLDKVSAVAAELPEAEPAVLVSATFQRDFLA